MNSSGSSSEGPFFLERNSAARYICNLPAATLKKQQSLEVVWRFFERKNIFFRICLAEGS